MPAPRSSKEQQKRSLQLNGNPVHMPITAGARNMAT